MYRPRKETKGKERALRDVSNLQKVVARSQEERARGQEMVLERSENVVTLRAEVCPPHHTIIPLHATCQSFVMQVKLLQSQLKSTRIEVDQLKVKGVPKRKDPAALETAKMQHLESEQLRLKSGVKLGEVQAKLVHERVLVKKVSSI